MRAAAANISISELVDEAVRHLMRQDQQDIAAHKDRETEKQISYEDLLNDLRKHGQI